VPCILHRYTTRHTAQNTSRPTTLCCQFLSVLTFNILLSLTYNFIINWDNIEKHRWIGDCPSAMTLNMYSNLMMATSGWNMQFERKLWTASVWKWLTRIKRINITHRDATLQKCKQPLIWYKLQAIQSWQYSVDFNSL
jgi:hypothetical protein